MGPHLGEDTPTHSHAVAVSAKRRVVNAGASLPTTGPKHKHGAVGARADFPGCHLHAVHRPHPPPHPKRRDAKRISRHSIAGESPNKQALSGAWLNELHWRDPLDGTDPTAKTSLSAADSVRFTCCRQRDGSLTARGLAHADALPACRAYVDIPRRIGVMQPAHTLVHSSHSGSLTSCTQAFSQDAAQADGSDNATSNAKETELRAFDGRSPTASTQTMHRHDAKRPAEVRARLNRRSFPLTGLGCIQCCRFSA